MNKITAENPRIPQNPTLKSSLLWAESLFVQGELYFGHGTDNAWDEAVALATHVLKLPIDADQSVLARLLTKSEQNAFQQLVLQRLNLRIPTPYLTGIAWYAGLPFKVSPDVLIPRSPLFEPIARQFKPWLKPKPKLRILDLCTGSACLAILLAKAFPKAEIVASDISNEALFLAKENCAKHDVSQQVELIQSDLFTKLQGKFDLIVSNPPYVPIKSMQELPAEYKHEPSLALESGARGDIILQKILAKAHGYLSQDGLLVVEVGEIENYVRKLPLPFKWLKFKCGGRGVFMLKAQDLI